MRRWKFLGRKTKRLVAVGVMAALVAPWGVSRGWYYYHLRAARAALEKGVADNAVLALTSADRACPGSAEVQFLLGVANRRAGHIDRVRKPLERAQELGWSKRSVKRQLLLLAFQAGDRKAEAELRESLNHPMTDELAEETYEALALGYLSEYRLIDAQTVLDYWIDWRPKTLRARLLRAELPWISGDRKKQLQEYEEILQLDPDNYAAHLTLAHLYIAQHAVEKAHANYRWCHDVWPGDPVATLGIAACLQHEGKLDEAMQAYEAMYRADAPAEQRAFLLSEMGQVYLNNGNYEKAVELLAESTELYPYDPNAEYSFGSALSKLGRKEEAKPHLARAKEIEGYRERLSDLEREVAVRAEDPDLRYETGVTLKQLGQTKASAAMMLAVLRWDPNHGPAHLALAEYYDQIGRDDLAQEHRALGRNTDGAGADGAAIDGRSPFTDARGGS